MRMIPLLLIATLLIGPTSQAYVLRGKFILAKTAKSHGSGPYRIEREVIIKTTNGDETIKEIWTVGADEKMRLEAIGGGTNRWEIDVLYSGGKRFFAESSGQVKSFAVSRDFFEPYFLAKSSSQILQMLVAQEIVPSHLLQKQKTQEKPELAPEGYVRLARLGGGVSYALGAPTPAGAPANKPGLWIEQDSFNIQKVRFRTQSEIVAEDYQEYDQNLSFPKLINVQWNNQVADIKTLSVKSIKPEAAEAKLQMKELERKASMANRKGPQDPVVLEFYSRFR